MTFDLVKELLAHWGFSKYIENFIENEIDIAALRLIDDAQIRELIPTIGPQAKFKKAIADWKAALQKKEGDDHIKEHNHHHDDEIKIFIEEYGKDVGGLTPTQTSPLISPASTPTSRKSSLCSLDLPSRINLNTVQDLTELLQTTQEGRHLLKRRDKPLGDALRKILVKEVAAEILKCDPEAPVRNVIYLHWIQQIEQVFPAENCSIYYTKASDGPGRAHGRLFDAVTNLKAKFRRNKVYQPRARRSLLDKTLTPEPPKEYANKRITSLLEEDSASISEENLDADPVIEDCLEWLRCSADNLALCTEKWAKTRILRLQRVLSKETHTYLLEFPCLQRSWGHSLLVADFNQWYPGNENSFENKFPLVKKKLIALFENVSNKSPFVKELKDLVNSSDPETSNIAALLTIPHLLGPVQIRKKKCAVAEVQKSFITRIENESLINEERRTRHETYKAIGITVQPYVIVVGPLKNITGRYVIVDDLIYELGTINSALDSCFKITWALNLKYAGECLPVWQFLQRAVYDVPNTEDFQEKMPGSVLALLNDCDIKIRIK